MTSERGDMNRDEFGAIEQLLVARRHPYAGCHIQLCVVRSADSWALYFEKAAFLDEEPHIGSRLANGDQEHGNPSPLSKRIEAA